LVKEKRLLRMFCGLIILKENNTSVFKLRYKNALIVEGILCIGRMDVVII